MPDQKQSFWSTLPGVLTAVAAVLGAIATLVTALYSSGLLGKKAQDTPQSTPAKVSTAAPGSTAFPESQETLRKYFTDMVDAAEVGNMSFAQTLARDMIIPNHARWFTETFGPEVGQRLAVEYSILVKRADTPEGLFNFPELLARDRTPIKVVRITDAADPNATGLQRKVLLASKRPLTLYTIELRGFTYWSFVYVEGAFRIAGKMRAAE